jgi:hypothetical protein
MYQTNCYIHNIIPYEPYKAIYDLISAINDENQNNLFNIKYI